MAGVTFYVIFCDWLEWFGVSARFVERQSKPALDDLRRWHCVYHWDDSFCETWERKSFYLASIRVRRCHPTLVGHLFVSIFMNQAIRSVSSFFLWLMDKSTFW